LNDASNGRLPVSTYQTGDHSIAPLFVGNLGEDALCLRHKSTMRTRIERRHTDPFVSHRRRYPMKKFHGLVRHPIQTIGIDCEIITIELELV
jgi:hypothetical protein